jgi:glycosyltransferase involved in cell wall biosynthesis
MALDREKQLDEREARVLRSLKDIERAVDVLAKEKLSPEAALSIGRVCIGLESPGLARRFFESALAADPRSALALNSLGQVAVTQGDYETAERYFVAAYEADPKFKVALENLLVVYGETDLLGRRWLEARTPTAVDLEAMRAENVQFAYRPLVSLIMPVYNQRPDYLEEALESCLAQVYDNWELCVADDASTDPRIRRILEDYQRRDPRIRPLWLTRNQHIAAASNRAIETARGTHIGFLDSDDRLVPHTLHRCVELLNRQPDLDLVYSDNAVIDEKGKVKGLMLKPDWSPEFFLSTNYIVHFCLYSREVCRKIGPFHEDEGHKGVQDIDIKARLLEVTDRVASIPEVLYFWRETDASVSSSSKAKPYVLENGRRVFQEVLDRRGIDARVEVPAIGEWSSRGIYRIVFPVESGRTVLVVSFLRHRRQAEALRAIVAGAKGACCRLLMFAPPGMMREPAPDVVQFDGTDAEVVEAVAARPADYVLLLDPAAEPAGPRWLAELRGYLDLDPAIGAVGGKIVSRQKRIAYGAYLFLDDLAIENEGLEEGCKGFWFNNVIAHNTSAVSRYCLLTRHSLFVAAGGLRGERYGAWSDVDYCLRLRQAGARIVFNPWSRLILDRDLDLRASEQGKANLRADYASLFGNDPYYNPGYSQRDPYALWGEADVGTSIRRAVGYLKQPPLVASGPEPAAFDAPAPSGGRECARLRINFVLPPAPTITGGPLAILEYANRLIDRGHEVSITTYPDVTWDGPSPFPWFRFKGELRYAPLAALIENEVAPVRNLTGEDAFYEQLTRRLLRIGGTTVLRDYLLSIGGRETKTNTGLEHTTALYLKWAFMLQAMPEECDLNIATYWETAMPVFLSRRGKPVYFMQHFEEVFYPNQFPWITTKLAVRDSYGLPLYKVANSSWLQRVMKDKYGQDIPFSNNAIELSDFGPAPKDSAQDGVLRVVTYSRPEEWKGFCDAVEAMSRVRERFPGRVEWHVFGYRNLEVPPRNERAPYTFHEKLSFRELAGLYARCDVALCPSWYESFPLPPLEAMASGTAVVTTEYGTEDYAHDGRTALVVKPRDVESMARAVLALLQDAMLRERLVANGLRMAETYGWDAAVERREAILLDIHEGRVGYDVFRSSGSGLADGAGIPFESAPADVPSYEGHLVRSADGVLPFMYLVHNGARRHVVEAESLAGSEYAENHVLSVDALTLARIPLGDPICSALDVPRIRAAAALTTVTA